MKKNRNVLIAIFVLSLIFGAVYIYLEAPASLPKGVFSAKPYLQLGNSGNLDIVWQAASEPPSDWSAEMRWTNGWTSLGTVNSELVSLSGVPPFRIFRVSATANDAIPFEYRILRNHQVVFTARANPRIITLNRLSFALFGDCGANSQGQKNIADQVFKRHPNFVVILGDIVYPLGRLRDYFTNFFSIYNADSDVAYGAPLMRSTLFVAVPGNHDIGSAAIFPVRNLDELSDGLAYFYEWFQPNNGPAKLGGPNIPNLLGSKKRQDDFLSAAGANYPGMTNFFFDKGNARFVVLDGNDYVDWTDPTWRQWLENTLAAAKSKTWRFVFFHQTAFNSDAEHFNEQRMRLISDILERNDVKIVFSGHAHNYQRTFPLQFAAKRLQLDSQGRVGGQVALAAVPSQGGYVTYITSGAGGATLTGANVAKDPKNWQPFTAKFIADQYSYTLCEVDGNLLRLTQISQDGTTLDETHIVSTNYNSGRRVAH